MKKLACVLAAGGVAGVLGLGLAPAAQAACTGSDGDSAATGVIITNPATGGIYNVDASTSGVSAGVNGGTGYVDADANSSGANVDGASSNGLVNGRAGTGGVCVNGMP